MSIPHSLTNEIDMPGSNMLKLISWNVNGLGEKRQDPDFIEMFSNYDMVCLTETWSSVRTNIKLKGFENPLHRFRYKRRKKGRRSGGILVYFKKHIAQGIKEMPKTHDDLLWLKLEKQFFSFDKDVFLCVAYIPPVAGQSISTAFSQMERDIARFSKLGEIFLSGDFNARTGTLKDYICDDQPDKYIQNSNDYSIDLSKHNTIRCNQDVKLNVRGRDLVDLCKSANLRICNGRTIGDLCGDYTVIKARGRSVVDYTIVGKDFMKNIVHMKIGDPTYLSDHNFVETVVNCQIVNNVTKKKVSPMKQAYDRFIWHAESPLLYREALKDVDSQAMIRNFLEVQYDKDNINIAVNDFTSILAHAGMKVLKLKQNKRKEAHSQKIKYQWFDDECYSLRRILRIKGRKLKGSDAIDEESQSFRKKCKKYKKLLKDKKKSYKQKLLKEMATLKSSNPKLYWDILTKIKNCDGLNKGREASNISPEEWYKHFKELAKDLDTGDNNDSLNPVLVRLEAHKNNMDLTELDFPFTIKEVKAAILSSKGGKSSSDDLILNEMLKCGLGFIISSVTKLFNLILNSERYPDLWNIAYQIPLFKGGDVYNPNDFRGISITSCFGKIFNKALNTRLKTKIESDRKLHDNQAAYRTDFSTTDQIFILKSLLNRYINIKKGRLYGCFVDFRKAFDSVWHKGLMYKLLSQYNIGGKLYGLIRSMYSNARSCVKLPDGVTQTFKLERGIKQGDTLSPYLFNLYLNDINDIFTGNDCCPPKLGDHKVNCLLYADDLLILSETSQGLQSALNKLNIYCRTWHLKINLKKTKVMIFSNRRKSENIKYLFGKENISITDKYTYLGINFTSNGSLKEAVSTLCDKAMKGMFSLCSSLYTGITVTPSLPLKVFDSTIRPILAYGSEVWSAEFLKLLTKPSCIDKAPFEMVNNKFCKYVAGMPRRASNFAIKAELGRDPIFSFICAQTLRYWRRMINLESCRILKGAYESELEIHKSGGISWVTFVAKLLEIGGTDNLVQNPDPVIIKTQCSNSKMKEKLSQFYFKYNYDTIGGHSKLRTYVTFKEKEGRELYLDLEDIPLKHRKLFCSFRISCHDLEIERGRYCSPPKSPDERICKVCNLQIETEEHFMLFCPKYRKLRLELFKSISMIDTTVLKIPHSERFVYLMNNQNIEIIKAVMNFLSRAYSDRALMLSGKFQ